jgi:hypothetical protein
VPAVLHAAFHLHRPGSSPTCACSCATRTVSTGSGRTQDAASKVLLAACKWWWSGRNKQGGRSQASEEEEEGASEVEEAGTEEAGTEEAEAVVPRLILGGRPRPCGRRVPSLLARARDLYPRPRPVGQNARGVSTGAQKAP